jgi:hypothetical protein
MCSTYVTHPCPGPALCLYFAAIRSTTNPPSVPLPRLDKHLPPIELSPMNCPPAYKPILRLWSDSVFTIQALSPEQQHDLARLVCGLPAIGPPRLQEGLPRISNDLRAVAIEISQRRTFQERYGSDLQAVIDSGSTPRGSGPSAASQTNSQIRASFQPPPAYEPSPTSSPNAGQIPLPASPNTATSPTNSSRPSSRASPRIANPDLPPTEVQPLHIRPKTPISATGHHQRTPSASSQGHAPSSPGLLSPSWVGGFAMQQQTPPPSAHHMEGSSSGQSSPRTPSLLEADTPAISLIRETLYAALADVLERNQAIRGLLRIDPPRAYFGTVALAVLDVCTTSVTADGGIVGVLGAALTLERCPPPLRPLMTEFGSLSKAAKAMDEEDSERAVQTYADGGEPGEPRLERVRAVLASGAGIESDSKAAEAGHAQARRSEEGTVLAFANRVSGLAMRMVELRPFRERQAEVFKILVGVGSR